MTENSAVRLGRWIREVFPHLPHGEFRLIPSDDGQNNDLVVLGGRWVFRFPRHTAGVARLPRLVRVLRLVRSHLRHLPTSSPDPSCVCLEPPEVGKAFLGYRLIPGRPLWPERLRELAQTDAPAVESLATQIALFLRELHAIPLPEVEAALPGEATGYRPLAHWEDLYARIARRLLPHMRADARASVAATFEAFLADARNRDVPPVLIHGDFGTGNWLHERAGDGGVRLTGVIDFDGARLDDPAVDIAAGCAGPAAFEEAFRRAYGVSEDLERRARFYRSTFVLQEALFGAEHDDPEAFGAISAYT